MHTHLLKSLAMVAMLLFYIIGVYGIAAPWLVSAPSTELTVAGFALVFAGIWPGFLIARTAYNAVLNSIQEFSK